MKKHIVYNSKLADHLSKCLSDRGAKVDVFVDYDYLLRRHCFVIVWDESDEN